MIKSPSRTPHPRPDGAAPARVPEPGPVELAVLRDSAAGRTLWESARTLQVSYWDARDARHRAVHTLCPGLAPPDTTDVAALPLIRPVTVAVTRGLITADHVPAPAGGPWTPTGAHQAAGRAVLSDLTNLQAAQQGTYPLSVLEAALSDLWQRAASLTRAHLAAVLLLHTPIGTPPWTGAP
ncbi:hypothetical protein [Streptomyces sp. CAU 1734]|uniref:hypothetical protein n=1 Tax=Streptomyces sp. CAU 1734 TaxID=3140360 RepID=UPI003260C58E